MSIIFKIIYDFEKLPKLKALNNRKKTKFKPLVGRKKLQEKVPPAKF